MLDFRKMKILFSLVILFMNSLFVRARKNCGCVDKPNYNSFISCDTINLKDGIMLFYQFNCDSSWLTIKKEGVYERVLNSFGENLIDMTPQLGYMFVEEYSSSILFMNRQISGGGIPFNYELIDKKDGKVAKKLGPIIYYSNDKSLEMIVTVLKDSIPVFVFHNIGMGTIQSFPIFEKPNNVTKSMNNDIYLENHFNNPKFDNGVFTIDYEYKALNNSRDWLMATILINTK